MTTESELRLPKKATLERPEVDNMKVRLARLETQETDIGGVIHAAATENNPSLLSEFAFWDFTAGALRKMEFFFFNAYLETAFNGIYGVKLAPNTWSSNNTFTSIDVSGSVIDVSRNQDATNTDAPVVSVLQEHNGDDQPALRVTQEGGGDVIQGYSGATLAFRVKPNGAVALTPVATVGNSLSVVRDLSDSNTDSPVVSLQQINVSDDQATLHIIQEGIGDIIQGHAGATLAFRVKSNGAVSLTPTPTSGNSLSVVRNLPDTSTDSPVVEVHQANASDDQPILQLSNDGVGPSFRVQDSSATVFIVRDGGTTEITQVSTTGNTLKATRNLAAASTDAPVASIVQDNAGDDQGALRVQQDGTGSLVELYSGATKTIDITSAGAVNIGNDGLAENTFHIGTTDGAFATARYVASAAGPGLVFKKSRNAAVGSHTVVQSGDEVGKILFTGSNGSAYQTAAQIVAKIDGTPGSGDMPGRIEFQVSPDGSITPAVALTISNTKVATFASSIVATGLGFGETTLSNYLEGSWTPTLSFGGGSTGLTYSVQVGRYTRVGNQVTAQGRLTLSNKGSSTGTATIGGLPVTSSNVTALVYPGSCYATNMTYTGTLQVFNTGNNTDLALQVNNAGASTSATQANFNNNSVLAFNLTYRVGT